MKISNYGVRTSLSFLNTFGWMGVNLFFILSGYLVTELLLRERERTSDINLSNFYIRRALRIWPLYFGFIAFATLVLPHFLTGDFRWGGTAHHEVMKWYVPSMLAFAGNLAFMLKGSYPLFHLISPLWSISMEEQFYLAWPALLKLTKKPRTLAAIFAALILGATYFRFTFHTLNNWLFLWLNPLCQMDTFAIGGLLALGFRNERFQNLLAKHFYLPYLGLPLALVAVSKLTLKDYSIVGRFTLINLSLASALICAMTSNTWKKSLSWGFLPWLGKISYGLYVVHMVGKLIAEKIVPVTSTIHSLILTTSLSLVISIAMAALSYYGFERYFLKLKDKFSSVKSRPV